MRAQSGLRGKRKWPLLMVLFLFSPPLFSGLFTFLPERGISEQTVQNKSFKVDKVRPPKKISAQSERARARARPKTCARGPFLIKRGISEKTVQNKSLKMDKVRPPKYFFFFFFTTSAATASAMLLGV